MHSARRIAVVLLGLFLTLAGSATWAAAPKVAVSIKPVHSIVAGLMEGVAEPKLLLRGDVNPYRATLDARGREALNGADLVLWAGPELEKGLVEPLSNLPDSTPVIELLAHPEVKILPARGVEDGAGLRDPYFWLDSRNVLILIDELTKRLMELDPEHQIKYEKNRTKVVESVSLLDRKLEYLYRGVSAKPIALYHDTLQYFEQAYATNVVAQASQPAGQEPDAAALLKARQKMVEEGVECFFTEATLPTPNLSVLMSNPDLRVAELDSLGGKLEPGPGLYGKLMRQNFETIRRCVKPDEAADHALTDVGDTLPSGSINGRFVLTNHKGETVSNLDFLGKYQIVYFGYTHCPDICPTSLAVLTSALNQLGDKAKQIQPIFITVDPARDTVPVMRSYVEYFHPRLVGLTGPESMIAKVAKNYHARYEKVPAEGAGEYFMDHTAGLYLMDPRGQFITKFAHGITPNQLAEELNQYIR